MNIEKKLKSILPLAKKSAKNMFKILKEKAPFHCTSLKADVFVTRIFLNHIIYFQKRPREEIDIFERVLIFSCIEEILLKGNLIELRESKYTYYKVSLEYHAHTLSVVISKTEKGYYLLSCFQDHFHKKKTCLRLHCQTALKAPRSSIHLFSQKLPFLSII